MTHWRRCRPGSRTVSVLLAGLVLGALAAAACGGNGAAPVSDPATLPPALDDPDPSTAQPEPGRDTPVEAPESDASAEANAPPSDAEPPATDAEPDETPSAAEPAPLQELTLEAFPVPAGSRPHDVAPALDGGVWYTAQAAGALGWLDPATGETRHVLLGPGSRPHGVIVGPDGAPWITDGGLNAIVRVDPETDAVSLFPLPPDRPNANLNTATFDLQGRLWFTGQNGIVGRLDPATGEIDVFDAPRGAGPYGITTTSAGDVYFASLAGSYVGRIDVDSGAITVLEPPTPGQGARRVWSDSQGRIWVSEWNAGRLALFDPATGAWREWSLPGPEPRAYAVFVDTQDIVWVSDFGGNALLRFDPATEAFTTFALPSSPGNVRQILGRPGEVWAPESAADQLVVIR